MALKPLRVLSNCLYVSQCMRHRLLNGGDDRVGRWSKLVVHPEAFAAGGDQSGASQIRQVPGGFWLGNLEALVYMADADFAGQEQAENPEPRAVSEGLEHGFQLPDVSLHIYALTDTEHRSTL